MSTSAQLLPDPESLKTFFDTLFKHADPKSFINLRSFEHRDDRGQETAFFIEGVALSAPHLIDRVIDRATYTAKYMRPAVFAPPVCTFRTSKGASGPNLANGLVIVAECDERPSEALRKLAAILGEPTLMVASGGRWLNTETGELEDKRHLYWRLTRPTRTDEEHGRLRECREIVASIAGADRTSISIVHPLRWAGSVHTKQTPHRLAEIIDQSEHEVELDVALDKLRAACPEHQAGAQHSSAEQAEGKLEDLASALERIRNDLDWDGWVKVGMALWRATGGSEDGLKLFLTFSAKNKQKFNEGDTRDRWTHIGKHPPDRIGAGSIFRWAKDADPTWLSPSWLRAKKEQSEDHLARLNLQYCVVLDGGKTRVLRFEEDQQNGHKRQVAAYLGLEDFRNFHMNQHVRVGDKVVQLGHWWLKHRDRRQYDGLVFQPGASAEIGSRLNLWRGWGVEPKPGDWTKMRAHIRDVLASGDAQCDEYIVRWIAWAVQNPNRRAEAALVFKGKKGTGKGTLGNALCRIFGQHGTHISSAEHLAGRFNGHLRDACLLFADEAYWPGDKASEGALKRLVTEPGLFIEAKGKDGFMATNMLHVMMASNDDWLVPAGGDERRYAVFNVSDCHKQDGAWFKAVNAEMENGGLGGMLHDLMHFDLGDWHPRLIPRTKALLQQQARGLSPEDAWWEELLQGGTLCGSDPKQPNRAVSNRWEEEVGKENFSTRTVRRNGLYDHARESSPRLKGYSDHLLGQILTGHGCDNGKKVLRRRGWTFPPLPQLREEWEARYPGWVWVDPDLAEWQPEVSAGA